MTKIQEYSPKNCRIRRFKGMRRAVVIICNKRSETSINTATVKNRINEI